MNNVIRDLTIAAGKVSPSKARLVLMVITLVMFVIAAGAPECPIDFIH